MKGKKISVITTCYRGEAYLGTFLENVARQTVLPEVELVLDHNEPSDKELLLIDAFDKEFPGILVHRVVRPVVPIGRSVNNCINAASGKYLCIWNVDDRRTADSLERMCATLDTSLDAGFTYGDFVVVDSLGKRNGKRVHCMEFDKLEFTRSMILGPFFMWRASLVSTVGLFDEQFKSGADFDFAIRLAMRSSGRKTEGNLGYFLDIGEGASTGASHVPKNVQPIERTVIELRYGIYDKIDYDFLPLAHRYSVPNLLQFGEWVFVEKLVPDYEKLMQDRYIRWFGLGMDNYFAANNSSVKRRSSRRGLLKRRLCNKSAER